MNVGANLLTLNLDTTVIQSRSCQVRAVKDRTCVEVNFTGACYPTGTSPSPPRLGVSCLRTTHRSSLARAERRRMLVPCRHPTKSKIRNSSTLYKVKTTRTGKSLRRDSEISSSSLSTSRHAKMVQGCRLQSHRLWQRGDRPPRINYISI
jgi:hypothetical protein